MLASVIRAWSKTGLTFSPCNTDTLGFNLIAETALIFPQGGRHAWLGPGRRNLTSGIIHISLRRAATSVAVRRCHRRVGNGCSC